MGPRRPDVGGCPPALILAGIKWGHRPTVYEHEPNIWLNNLSPDAPWVPVDTRYHYAFTTTGCCKINVAKNYGHYPRRSQATDGKSTRKEAVVAAKVPL